MEPSQNVSRTVVKEGLTGESLGGYGEPSRSSSDVDRTASLAASVTESWNTMWYNLINKLTLHAQRNHEEEKRV